MTTPKPAGGPAVGAARVAGALSDVAVAHLRANAAEAVGQRSGRFPAQPVVIAAQLLGVAEDIVSGARKDPSMVFELMQGEAGRRLSSLGLATSAQVEALRAEVAALRVEVSVLKGESPPDTDDAAQASATHDEPKAAVTKSPPSRKVAAPTKSPPSAKVAPAKKTSKKSTPAKKTAAQKTATKKSAPAEPAPAQDSAEEKQATAAPEQTDERQTDERTDQQ